MMVTVSHLIPFPTFSTHHILPSTIPRVDGLWHPATPINTVNILECVSSDRTWEHTPRSLQRLRVTSPGRVAMIYSTYIKV